MKAFILVVAGAALLPLPMAQAAPPRIAPSRESPVKEADVRCAYLTEDGYCVRPHKQHRHWKRWHHQRRIYDNYEPQPQEEYDWRYERQRPIIRVIPRDPQDEGNWDDWND